MCVCVCVLVQYYDYISITIFEVVNHSVLTLIREIIEMAAFIYCSSGETSEKLDGEHMGFPKRVDIHTTCNTITTYTAQTPLTTKPQLATDIAYNTTTTYHWHHHLQHTHCLSYHRHHSIQHNHHYHRHHCTIQPPLTTDITVYNTTTIYHRHHSTTQPPTTDITVYNTTTIYHRQHHLQHNWHHHH